MTTTPPVDALTRPGRLRPAALIRLASALATALALLAWGMAGPAAAEDTPCTGTIGAVTLDTIVVPDGASCTLEGTRAEGNVIVGTGSTLRAEAIEIDGNIQAEGAAQVTVDVGTIGGDVQLFQGTAAAVRGTRIDGDLQMESNDGALSSDGNTVGGNLQANQNTGGLAIVGNTIDGDLQCQANDPAPTGSGNTVGGSAEDQCATLTGGDPDPTPTDPTPTDPGATARPTSRLAGPDRFATAVAIAQRAFPQTAPVVYLARADVAADALAAGSLYDGPILLVPACGDVPDVVLAEIRRLDPAEVIALGGEGAVCSTTLQQAAAA